MSLNNIDWSQYGKSDAIEQTSAIVIDEYDGLPWFRPIKDQLYKFTVVGFKGWHRQVSVPQHALFDFERQFRGKISCKKKWQTDSIYCPLCEANKQAEVAVGRKIENKDLPFPRTVSCIMLVIVDGENHKFAYYRTWSKQIEQIRTQLEMSSGKYKLAIKRTGVGVEGTNYNIVCTQEPVNEEQLKLAFDAVSEPNEQSFIDAADYTKVEKFLKNKNKTNETTLYTETQKQKTTPLTELTEQEADETGILQFAPFPKLVQNNSNMGDISNEAFEFTMQDGPQKGKKLIELDNNLLALIANNMTGDVAKFAKEIIGARKIREDKI